MTFFEFIFTALSTIFGGVFVVGLVAFIYKRDAIHWEYLAKHYGRPWQTPRLEKWGHLVLYGKHPVSKAYNGITKIGLTANGLAIKVMPPFGFFCDPLFIPFKDIKSWDQDWYLNAKTVELELKNAPEVKLAMPRSQLEWIRRRGGIGIEVNNAPSPHKAKPVIWHNFLIFTSAFMFFSLIVTFVVTQLR